MRNKADLRPDSILKPIRPRSIGGRIPPMPPKPPSVRVVNEDRPTPKPRPKAPSKPSFDELNTTELRLRRIEKKVDGLKEHMDQQFMNLAGLLDKFVASQAPQVEKIDPEELLSLDGLLEVESEIMSELNAATEIAYKDKELAMLRNKLEARDDLIRIYEADIYG